MGIAHGGLVEVGIIGPQLVAVADGLLLVRLLVDPAELAGFALAAERALQPEMPAAARRGLAAVVRLHLVEVRLEGLHAVGEALEGFLPTVGRGVQRHCQHGRSDCKACAGS
jgi:hypothetical protein